MAALPEAVLGLPSPLAVVAHDAGAANIILAWLQAERIPPTGVLPVMDGPAARLWDEAFPDAPGPVPLDDAIAAARTVLSGTGWASDLEHLARGQARRLGLPSIAVIDHWVNYRMRFERSGELILPDRVWVTDHHALAEASRALPEINVELRPNLYLQNQAHAAGPTPKGGDILFVLEPARSDWGRGEPGEFQALDWFWAHRQHVASTGTSVRLRPHPSDPPGKYEAWINTHPGSSLDRSDDMAGALSTAAVVVGLQSAALVIALAAGRRAVTALPPWAPPCGLPHPGITRLSDQR